MRPLFSILCLAAALCVHPGAALAQHEPARQALMEQDRRLARIADAMLVANHELCRQFMPVTGMILHSRDQYGGTGSSMFDNGDVAILAVTDGSPAVLAQLQPGDGIVAIGGAQVEGLAAPDETIVRDMVFDMLSSEDPARPLELLVRREGQQLAAVIQPEPGCRALVEILAGKGNVARSDGRVIQISQELAEKLNDDALAAIFAHELGHLVLEHRRRLSELGVSKGLFAEFGRNRRLNKQAEIEADRISPYLLANAGIDPRVAASFWRSPAGRDYDAGIFRSAIYPSPEKRAEWIEQEIDGYISGREGPHIPRHLLEHREAGFEPKR